MIRVPNRDVLSVIAHSDQRAVRFFEELTASANTSEAAIAAMVGGGLVPSFETVAANLDASGAVLAYSGGDLVSITYANGVVKTFAYGPDGLASVTLSGVLPSGIDLIKTLTYTSGELTAFNYS